jgi:hypothetical protein
LIDNPRLFLLFLIFMYCRCILIHSLWFLYFFVFNSGLSVEYEGVDVSYVVFVGGWLFLLVDLLVRFFLIKLFSGLLVILKVHIARHSYCVQDKS